MKKYYLFLLGLTLLVMVTACKSKSNSEKNKENTPFTISSILEIDEVLTKADEFIGKEIEAEGICTHICQHGGAKIFLMGSDDSKTIRIEAGDKIGKFNPETVNNMVRVKGTVVESKIDEEYLIQWENRIKEDTAEKHGTGEAGCATEQKAQGESPVNSEQERIENFRKRIAKRNEKEGKDYLSFYHIEASEYTIQ